MIILPEEISGNYVFSEQLPEESQDEEAILICNNAQYSKMYLSCIKKLNTVYGQFQKQEIQQNNLFCQIYFALFFLWVFICAVSIILVKVFGAISPYSLFLIGLNSFIIIVLGGFATTLYAWTNYQRRMVECVRKLLEEWRDEHVDALAKQTNHLYTIEWYTFDVVWKLVIKAKERGESSSKSTRVGDSRHESLRRRNSTPGAPTILEDAEKLQFVITEEPIKETEASSASSSFASEKAASTKAVKSLNSSMGSSPSTPEMARYLVSISSRSAHNSLKRPSGARTKSPFSEISPPKQKSNGSRNHESKESGLQSPNDAEFTSQQLSNILGEHDK